MIKVQRGVGGGEAGVTQAVETSARLLMDIWEGKVARHVADDITSLLCQHVKENMSTNAKSIKLPSLL